MEELEDVALSGIVDTRFLCVNINVSTTTIIVHTHELLNESVLSLKTEFHTKKIMKLFKTLKAQDGLCIDLINYILYYTL